MQELVFKAPQPYNLLSFGRVGVDVYPNDLNCPVQNIRSFSFFIGGSPANTTVGASKLGLKTAMISKVAKDFLADFIFHEFHRYGIDTNHIMLDESGATTHLAVAQVLAPGQTDLVFYRNNPADVNIAPEEISEELIASTQLLHISGTAMSASPSREAALVAIDYAKKHGVIVSMDIDYRPYCWRSPAEVAVYNSMLAERCDIVIGTREEFDVMETIVDPANRDDAKTARRLLEKDTKLVVVKRGQGGSTAYTKDGRTVKGGIFPVQVVNTQGAGDSFASGFLYAALQGFPLEDCLAHAAASASFVVGKNDCSEAMPTPDELHNFMQTNTLQV